MSRLDDELKLMFQRQEPSADFAKRVLAQINVEPQPKRSFWQSLIRFFQLPTMRWAVAATALLLIAIIGVVQYQRLNKNAVAQQTTGVQEIKPDENKVAKDPATPTVDKGSDGIKELENERTNSSDNQTGVTTVNNRNLKPHHQQKLKYRKASSVKDKEVIATQQKSEGEIAKEQLMKALFIASATVNEAKKVAMGGD